MNYIKVIANSFQARPFLQNQLISLKNLSISSFISNFLKFSFCVNNLSYHNSLIFVNYHFFLIVLYHFWINIYLLEAVKMTVYFFIYFNNFLIYFYLFFFEAFYFFYFIDCQYWVFNSLR